MKRTNIFGKISGAALIPVLAFALGSSAAYAQDRDDHRDMQRDNARGGARDNARGDARDNARGDERRDRNDRGRDFHFNDQHRERFAQRYHGDADHWRDRRDRVHFERGERIPAGYRIQPVPTTYYREVPPPPPGYRYGYYQGYVVAYDPTTRMIGDVLDLVGATMNR
jgi:Ni/Co efflux regulator RcnB